jgi:hypothetical protein
VTHARFTIIESLLTGAPANLTVDLVDALDNALSDLDPLVNFSMQVGCPYCATSGVHDLPLAACALRVLAATQAELLRTMHALAAGYGWTENEILAIPEWRRNRYVDLLAEQGGRS